MRFPLFWVPTIRVPLPSALRNQALNPGPLGPDFFQTP